MLRELVTLLGQIDQINHKHLHWYGNPGINAEKQKNRHRRESQI